MATMAAGDEPRNATIYTVAERAGVSHQTVSRYLKGESLRPKNRDAVVAALADLDYQVNDIARTLATKKPGRIGAFVFDVDDWAP
ncbi:regulatory protein, lacI family [Propioniciclava tarda]|nr:regulatory protein, lacI family [Propioniciclava tarda]